MPFGISALCELLHTLDHIQTKTPPRATTAAAREDAVILDRFSNYTKVISCCEREAIAFLSYLFLERRYDRVYGLKETRFEGIIKQALY